MFTEFLSLEFVIAVSTVQTIMIIDIRTSKSMLLATLPRDPDFIAFFPGTTPRLAIVINGILTFYDIFVPWALWTTVPTLSRSIRRYPAPEAPARVLVVAQGNLVEMIQPQTANVICNAGLSRLDGLSSLIYDRGCVVAGGMMLKTAFILSVCSCFSRTKRFMNFEQVRVVL
jgi:hypothetical protein